ncbi:MAG: hypothetical protein NT015_16740 [Alphaproteobacteria bacterium]|nr:hypothetical protein [Alphaproteobacteria bacterium]
MNLIAEASISDGRNTLPQNVAVVAARHGLEILDAEAIREARTLAAQLIGEGVATAECLIALQSQFGAALFGLRQEGALTGLLAAFPLNEAGLEALEHGAFDAVALDTALVARPGETPAAYYGWAFAATNQDGGRAVMMASVDIHRLLYWAVPTFARAVTADGSRALQRIGFRPHATQAALFVIAPALNVGART